MISMLDALSMLRRFRGYLAGAGGVGDMMNALKWSVWYALKWWADVKSSGRTDTPLARALYRSLLHHGYIDEKGEVVKKIERPERPKGAYAQEWLNLHESFDELLPKLLSGAGGDLAKMLLYAMQAQGWYKLWRDDFLKAAGFRGKRVFEPRMRGGHNAADIYAEYTPELYAGYEESDEAVELLLQVVPNVNVGSCPGSGVCVFPAASACGLEEVLEGLKIEEVLLFNVLHWMEDPLKELLCIKRAAPGALFYVGQPVVETMPGFLAINTASGAYHVFSREDVEGLLQAAGLKRRRLLLREIPFYASVWA
ncbi:MAG: hypothetical protein QXP98_01535 [Thermoproteus sp.]